MFPKHGQITFPGIFVMHRFGAIATLICFTGLISMDFRETDVIHLTKLTESTLFWPSHIRCCVNPLTSLCPHPPTQPPPLHALVLTNYSYKIIWIYHEETQLCHDTTKNKIMIEKSNNSIHAWYIAFFILRIFYIMFACILRMIHPQCTRKKVQQLRHEMIFFIAADQKLYIAAYWRPFSNFVYHRPFPVARKEEGMFS